MVDNEKSFLTRTPISKLGQDLWNSSHPFLIPSKKECICKLSSHRSLLSAYYLPTIVLGYVGFIKFHIFSHLDVRNFLFLRTYAEAGEVGADKSTNIFGANSVCFSVFVYLISIFKTMPSVSQHDPPFEKDGTETQENEIILSRHQDNNGQSGFELKTV